MSASTARAGAALDGSAAKILRIALATPVAAIVANAAGLPIVGFAAVFVLALFAPLIDRFAWKPLILVVLLVATFTVGLQAVLAPFADDRASYLTLIFVLLATGFTLQNNPRLAPVGAIAVPMTTLLATLVPVSTGAVRSLAYTFTGLGICAAVAIIVAWAVFPNPAMTPTPPPRPLRSRLDALICAAILTTLIGVALRLDAQSAIRLLMIASGILSVPDPRLTGRTGAALLVATALGIAGATIMRSLLAVASTDLTMMLFAALVPLLLGRRLTEPATAQVATTALLSMWVLLGMSGDVDNSKLVSFFLYTIVGIAAAIGLRHTLLWHLDPARRAALTS